MQRGLNFTRTPNSRRTQLSLFGTTCACITLDKSIEVKRAAGRPQDLEAVAELETIREALARG